MFWKAILVVQLFLYSAYASGLEKVDTLLVLATDVSASVSDSDDSYTGNPAEFPMQKEGIRWALNQPEVAQAIRCGKYKKSAIQYLEWADQGQQQVVIPWTIVHDEASLQQLGERIFNEPRKFYNGQTDVRGGIDFAIGQLISAPYFGNHRVIDVSGDGEQSTLGEIDAEHNSKILREARDRATSLGIVINGLAIINEAQGLKQYYQDNVITGPGSFVVPVTTFEEYGQALKRKLIRELCNVIM